MNEIAQGQSGSGKTYSDPHLNIFAAYGRGRITKAKVKPTVMENDKAAYERHRRALEDNVTRAFLATLSHVAPEVQQKLLKPLLYPEDTVTGNPCPDACAEPIKGIFLQTSPDQAVIENIMKPNRRIVVINTVGNWPVENHPAADTGRPDGWILWDHALLAFESKLNSNPDEKQLIKHAEVLGLSGTDALKPAQLHSWHWEDVEKISRSLATEADMKQPDAFLLNQLADFLAAEGLGLMTDRILDMVGSASDEWLSNTRNRVLVLFAKLATVLNSTDSTGSKWTAGTNQSPQQVYISAVVPKTGKGAGNNGISLNLVCGQDPGFTLRFTQPQTTGAGDGKLKPAGVSKREQNDAHLYFNLYASTELVFARILHFLAPSEGQRGLLEDIKLRVSAAMKKDIEPVLEWTLAHKNGALLRGKGNRDIKVQVPSTATVDEIRTYLRDEAKEAIRQYVRKGKPWLNDVKFPVGTRLSVKIPLDDDWLGDRTLRFTDQVEIIRKIANAATAALAEMQSRPV